ncbi:MAG TPA: polysaccharide biosynthesis/export family protein [Bryobacteraceae bacterium]|nr:polysaccharide biosynthesis/export family protein [Bryobacteraceae bacterium]
MKVLFRNFKRHLPVLVLVTAASAFGQTAPLRTTPVLDQTANLPAQRIGPSDLVAIAVYDAPELTRTIRVDEDGFIRMPMLSERIKAAGLMPAELETAIAKALKAEQLIVDPYVTVTVAEYESRPISVAGAVKQPIRFQAIGKVTLLDAITRAGGLSPEAGPEILVSRAEDEGAKAALVQRISVRGLFEAADPELNITLNGGEEIRIPESGKVYVVGNVKKPGAFPVQEAAQTSVLKVLALAEGLDAYASKQAYIYRREAGPNGKKSEIPIELNKIMQRKAPDAPLYANDILYVPDNSGRRTAITALEKFLLFASGASTAAIYGVVR